jgi:hypothetical protein
MTGLDRHYSDKCNDFAALFSMGIVVSFQLHKGHLGTGVLNRL